ncbi:MAG: response regulator [Candidatus Omnitrophota bacterium]
MTQNDKEINILLIDDEIDLAEMTAYQLKAKGFKVELASNGQEGLDKLQTFTPHLIILDLNMPVMGGLEFYQHILDENKKPKFPVLILTARAYLDNVLSGLSIEGYITKPFELEDLLKRVKSATEKLFQI